MIDLSRVLLDEPQAVDALTIGLCLALVCRIWVIRRHLPRSMAPLLFVEYVVLLIIAALLPIRSGPEWFKEAGSTLVESQLNKRGRYLRSYIWQAPQLFLTLWFAHQPSADEPEGSSVHRQRTSGYLALLEALVSTVQEAEIRQSQPLSYQFLGPTRRSVHLTRRMHRFRLNEIAGLPIGAYVVLNRNPELRGRVIRTAAREVIIRFETALKRKAIPRQGTVQQTSAGDIYSRQRQAIAALREGRTANPHLVRILTERMLLPFSPRRSGRLLTSSTLDPDQRDAVIKAGQVPDILLIKALPGTGKARTIAEIIRQCALRGDSVLVVSFTNLAADSLLGGMPQGMRKVRIGSRDNVSIDPQELAALNTTLIDPTEDATATVAEQIRLADVTIGTRVATARVPADLEFDVLIVDEAERIPLLDALTSLVQAKRAILVGDDRQLPPFVHPEVRNWADRLALAPSEQRPVADVKAILATSLFELLLPDIPDSNKALLSRQRRMPSSISDFVSSHFYEGELTTSIANVYNEPPGSAILPQAFTIIDTSDLPFSRRAERLARRNGASRVGGYVNPIESEIIAALIAAEKRLGGDWAVLVPYRAQADLIKQRLARVLGDPVEAELRVGTVDSFSGTERDLVIVGCTRSNHAGATGFLGELRRFNVAMTRARRQLVVVGDMRALTTARDLNVRALISAMATHVQRRGEILSSQEFMRRLPRGLTR